jgi:VWFA-related protein
VSMGRQQPGGDAPQATFRSRTARVRLDVSVVGDGARPLRDLSARDFDVRDRGVVQTVDVLPLGGAPLTVMLAFDLSGSVRGSTLAQLKRAAATVAGLLTAGDRVGLVLFASGLEVIEPREPNPVWLSSAMNATFSVADTSLVDATFAAMTSVEAIDTPKIVVVFSDGADTSSYLPASAVIEAAKRGSTVVCAVYSQRPGGHRYLEDLTEATGGEAVSVARVDDVAESVGAVLARYRQGYLVSYQPTDGGAPGWHDVSVRVRRSGARVFVRPGYTVREERR